MKLFDKCPECRGTGMLPIGESGSSPCGRCSASGRIESGSLDIDDQLKTIQDYSEKILDIVSKGKDK